jgi:hypothetical protein
MGRGIRYKGIRRGSDNVFLCVTIRKAVRLNAERRSDKLSGPKVEGVSACLRGTPNVQCPMSNVQGVPLCF